MERGRERKGHGAKRAIKDVNRAESPDDGARGPAGSAGRQNVASTSQRPPREREDDEDEDSDSYRDAETESFESSSGSADETSSEEKGGSADTESDGCDDESNVEEYGDGGETADGVVSSDSEEGSSEEADGRAPTHEDSVDDDRGSSADSGTESSGRSGEDDEESDGGGIGTRACGRMHRSEDGGTVVDGRQAFDPPLSNVKRLCMLSEAIVDLESHVDAATVAQWKALTFVSSRALEAVLSLRVQMKEVVDTVKKIERYIDDGPDDEAREAAVRASIETAQAILGAGVSPTRRGPKRGPKHGKGCGGRGSRGGKASAMRDRQEVDPSWYEDSPP